MNCYGYGHRGVGSLFSKAVKKVKKAVAKVKKAVTVKAVVKKATEAMSTPELEATQKVSGALAQRMTAKGVDDVAARRMAEAIVASDPGITPEKIDEAARQAAEKYAAGGGKMLKTVGLGAGAVVLALGLVGAFYFATRSKKVKEEGR